ncbi:MAG TPA: hypothetical protein PKK94_11720 [Leptospiraceae bacterium]|nr:hypothetical protein [Leptospiraceae bacterium]
MANVKNELAEWFIRQDHNYFNRVFKDNKNKLISDLDSYNEQLNIGDIFECDAVNYKEVISKISKEIYEKKIKIDSFFQGKKGDIPRAILGKDNYFKFVREKFGSKEGEIMDVSESNKASKENKFPMNQILYGPPGTGKTYNTMNKAIQIINPEFFLGNRTEVRAEYERLVREKQITFTTFHQSMSYEDFVEGIKPINRGKKDFL